MVKNSTNPIYTAWARMIQRCTNEKCRDYPNWGGRGIKVCERWRHSPDNFYADMGDKPSPLHSLDRIDNDGDYEPTNCRWATRKEQALNQRKEKKIALAKKIAANRSANTTHCPLGHEYTAGNTYTYRGSRHCKTCKVVRDRFAYYKGKFTMEELNYPVGKPGRPPTRSA